MIHEGSRKPASIDILPEHNITKATGVIFRIFLFVSTIVNLLHHSYIDLINHAHLPNTAINPAPKHIHPKADIVIPTLLLRISLLNMNSWAISSTRPV